MITSSELRQKYLDFFVSKNHKIIPSASLIPENDPTALFTMAGMHPLVPYLLGIQHPSGKRLVNIQKCVRMQDIDDVGDNRHDTFFEMLGNWSLGDYFKSDSIKWSWEFLTSPAWLGLDPRKISVTVFAGDADAPRDDESAEIWKELGMPENRIAYLPKADNWWNSPGATGPCGPDTEIFWWRGVTEFPPEGSNAGNDPDNWLEVWNNVFMQYEKTADGKFVPLKQQNVDTGMGVERTLVALNGFIDVFQIDTLKPLLDKIEILSGNSYAVDAKITRSMRIVADHIRTATMIMGDDKGIAPSNVDQGYIVRRLIRRAVRHGRVLGLKENFCSRVAEVVIEIFKDIYPEVSRNRAFIMDELAKEESKFRNTIEQGMIILDNEFKVTHRKIGDDTPYHINEGEHIPLFIDGKWMFDFFQSYGFPFELLCEELLHRNKIISIEIPRFREEFGHAFKAHQDLSRAGAEQKFKGGLADQGEMSVKYHTATHLLHAALRAVLGDKVEQRGSNITAERMRFDFSHPEKMTDEQKTRVEELVNYAIKKDYHVGSTEMTVSEAKTIGAMGLFEDKYGAKVKVYSVGDPGEIPSAHENSLTFSKEICGGPHVASTGVLGAFKIIKEEAVSSGVRRIKATLS